MMEWLSQNAFQLLALGASIGSGVWAASRAYYTLDNRITNIEQNMERLDKKLDEDIQQLRNSIMELRADIKHLTQLLLKSKD
jgi:hypothetical protein